MSCHKNINDKMYENYMKKGVVLPELNSTLEIFHHMAALHNKNLQTAHFCYSEKYVHDFPQFCTLSLFGEIRARFSSILGNFGYG